MPEWLPEFLGGLGTATVLGLLLKALLGILEHRRKSREIEHKHDEANTQAHLDEAKLSINIHELDIRANEQEAAETKMLLEQQREWNRQMGERFEEVWAEMRAVRQENADIRREHARCLETQRSQALELAKQAEDIARLQRLVRELGGVLDGSA